MIHLNDSYVPILAVHGPPLECPLSEKLSTCSPSRIPGISPRPRTNRTPRESTSLPASRYGPATVRDRFGFGSVSGELILCPRWRFIMQCPELAAICGLSRRSYFGIGSGGVSIEQTQKQYRCRSSTYKANHRRYVFLLINGSLVRARDGEPISFSKSIGYVDFHLETHRLLVFRSLVRVLPGPAPFPFEINRLCRFSAGDP